jgi:chemotaxis protein CheX
MKMQLIQPFISAADCVLASALQGPAKIGDLSMDEGGFHLHGCAVRILIHGEIEGCIILDMTPETAARIATTLAGEDIEPSDQLISETVFELANMMIGNAVTLLNDHGYQFKVLPPEKHTENKNAENRTDMEETAIYFETSCGRIFLNICMRYNLRPRTGRMPVLTH